MKARPGVLMKNKFSFSHIEQELRHSYRNNLNNAESDEDVKKFFVYIVSALFNQAYEGQIRLSPEDITLDEKKQEYFFLRNTLMNNTSFMQVWNGSDLPKIVRRMAESAVNRIKHLEGKHPDKTEAKMYPTPSHSGQRFLNKPLKRK